MKRCPFCKGQVPDEALKCQHCGEWTDGRGGGARSELGRAAMRFVNVYLAASVVALLLAIFLFCYFVFPSMMAVRRDFFH